LPTRRQKLRDGVFETYGKQCYYCGGHATGRAMRIDYLDGDAVPACRDCLTRKGAMPFDAYVKSRLQQLRAERDILVARYRERC
jgi:hypothetical protein